MMLESLKEFAERIELPRKGYGNLPIRFMINIDDNGRLSGIVPTDGSSKAGKLYELPLIEKTSGIRANLLSGNIEYVLGLPRSKELEKQKEAGKEAAYLEKVRKRHDAFIALVDSCLSETSNESMKAVRSFLSTEIEKTANGLPEERSDADNFSFAVDGTRPTDEAEVARFWANYLSGADDEEESAESNESEPGEVVVPQSCMLCGEDKQPLATHLKIKPVPGGQSSGVAIMSGNKNAFYSYGLRRAFISPLCRDCSEPIHQALLWLIKSDYHKLRFGDKGVFLFWTREPIDFHVAMLLNEPTEENVKSMLESPLKGKGTATELQANKLYMLLLSGNGGRAVVRSWMETSVVEAQSNLKSYFAGQLIANSKQRYQKLWALIGATTSGIRNLSDEVAPWVPQALLEYALMGDARPLPSALLSVAIRRCVVGKTNPGSHEREHVSAQQAALVKLCLVSWFRQQGSNPPEDWMIKLDTQNKEPGYLYGRLFNVLEQIQEAATGGNSVERTFGTAIMSPVSTLPRLIARSTVHTRKLMRDKPGAAVNYNKLLSEIQGKLEPNAAFKHRLDAREQGLFVLGYWHQNAARYEKRSENNSEESN